VQVEVVAESVCVTSIDVVAFTGAAFTSAHFQGQSPYQTMTIVFTVYQVMNCATTAQPNCRHAMHMCCDAMGWNAM
jgi:hypothetical protein